MTRYSVTCTIQRVGSGGGALVLFIFIPTPKITCRGRRRLTEWTRVAKTLWSVGDRCGREVGSVECGREVGSVCGREVGSVGCGRGE